MPNVDDPRNAATWIRTLVYVGGHDLGKVEVVAAAGPDALCVDLEDSTPLADKDLARSNLASIASIVSEAGSLLFVRVNGGAQEADDLAACAGLGVHCINIAKVEEASMVAEFVGRLVGDLAGTWVRPVIETPLGVLRAYEIAAASPLVAYMGGVEGGIYGDLGGALGYQQTEDGVETHYLRSKVLMDVRAARVPFPIGGGTTSRRDVDGAVAFARANRALGYAGVHCAAEPEIVRAVNEALTPTPEELVHLTELVPRLEEIERTGAHVAHLDGKVYDLVALQRLREQLELGRRLGLVEGACR